MRRGLVLRNFDTRELVVRIRDSEVGEDEVLVTVGGTCLGLTDECKRHFHHIKEGDEIEFDLYELDSLSIGEGPIHSKASQILRKKPNAKVALHINILHRTHAFLKTSA